MDVLLTVIIFVGVVGLFALGAWGVYLMDTRGMPKQKKNSTHHNPMVSVVIPTYNRAGYIQEAIRSVLSQKQRPLELLIVNDCSTDNTTDVVNAMKPEIQQQGVELRVIWHTENLGCGASTKHGFEAATGEYITYLASDDLYLDPESLRNQSMAMARQNADWSYYRDLMIGPSIAESRLYKPSFIPRMRFLDLFIVHRPRLMCCVVFWKNAVNSSSIMIRKATYDKHGGWFEWTRNADCDGALILHYTYLGLHCVALEGAPVLYRTHPGQVSHLSAQREGKLRSRGRMLATIQCDAPLWMRALTRFFNWMRWTWPK